MWKCYSRWWSNSIINIILFENNKCLQIEQGDFHVECFKCQRCDEPITSEYFLSQKNAPVVEDLETKLPENSDENETEISNPLEKYKRNILKNNYKDKHILNKLENFLKL